MREYLCANCDYSINAGKSVAHTYLVCNNVESQFYSEVVDSVRLIKCHSEYESKEMDK